MTSAAVLQRMNLSADPCEDFYEYACGGFARDPQTPNDQAKYSQFSVIRGRNLALVRQVRDVINRALAR